MCNATDACRWVNRKDPQGNNLFGGGFLGLDNIGKDLVKHAHI